MNFERTQWLSASQRAKKSYKISLLTPSVAQILGRVMNKVLGHFLRYFSAVLLQVKLFLYAVSSVILETIKTNRNR